MSPLPKQNNPEPLPSIPMPLSARWREFRVRTMPFVVFATVGLAVAYLWRHGGVTPGFPGIAEGVRSQISSPRIGVLQHVLVSSYQVVQAGDPVAVVLPVDPMARIDLVQTELEIARLRLIPSPAQDNAVNLERLRVDLMRQKSELAMARVNLQRAESEVRRSGPLYKAKLLSEDAYELAINNRELFKTEVLEKSNVVSELEFRLGELRGFEISSNAITNDPRNVLADRLQSVYDAASTNWGPIILRAPITGMVSGIWRQAGENVAEGEPLVVLSSLESDRIVCYLRQPYGIEPKPHMKVRVTTRERKRQQFLSEISQVGAHVEVITNALAFVREGALVDSGLPITVALPAQLKLRPGELVDVALEPESPLTSETAMSRAAN